MAALTTQVRAVKQKYRPPEGTVPWYKEASVGELVNPEYPHDYFVPDFGVDSDIKLSQANTEAAE
jgi:hypothetical protein